MVMRNIFYFCNPSGHILAGATKASLRLQGHYKRSGSASSTTISPNGLEAVVQVTPFRPDSVGIDSQRVSLRGGGKNSLPFTHALQPPVYSPNSTAIVGTIEKPSGGFVSAVYDLVEKRLWKSNFTFPFVYPFWHSSGSFVIAFNPDNGLGTPDPTKRFAILSRVTNGSFSQRFVSQKEVVRLVGATYVKFVLEAEAPLVLPYVVSKDAKRIVFRGGTLRHSNWTQSLTPDDKVEFVVFQNGRRYSHIISARDYVHPVAWTNDNPPKIIAQRRYLASFGSGAVVSIDPLTWRQKVLLNMAKGFDFDLVGFRQARS